MKTREISHRRQQMSCGTNPKNALQKKNNNIAHTNEDVIIIVMYRVVDYRRTV